MSTSAETYTICPLEWSPNANVDPQYQSRTIPRLHHAYEVLRLQGGGCMWRRFVGDGCDDQCYPCETIEEAKQAAEDDWQDRIRKALMPVATKDRT